MMTQTQEFTEFKEEILTLPVVCTFLRETAGDLIPEWDGSPTRIRGGVFGDSNTLALLSVALFLLVKLGVDHLRKLSDVDAAGKLIGLVKQLTESGFNGQQSTQVIERLLKAIRSQPSDNQLIRSLVTWIGPRRDRDDA
jgi:hypothetical protein